MAIKQQVMALNPARKGNMGRLNSSQPLYVYDTLIVQPWLKGVIAQIRGEKAIPGVDAGDEKAVKKAREGLKRQLPIRAIHYYKFRNNHRSSEDADPESFLFQTTIDVDDVDYVDAALEKARELNCSNTIWKGKLLHLEYSARKKLHIDIRMPMGMTIEETQKAYCEAAGIPYDKSCITPERIIFITDKDSEIYRSKEWYGVLPDEEIKARREAFLKRGLTIDGKGTARYSLLAGDCKSPERLAGDFQGQVPSDSNHKVQSSNLKVQSNDDVQDNRFQGTDSYSAVSSGAAIQPAQPGNSHRADDDYISHTGGSQNADAKNLIAFDLFQDSAGLKGMNIDTIGSRHSSLLAIMSAGASRVMSEEELMKVVAMRMPSYYQENDCHQLIHDFYSKYGDSSKPFSRDVIRVNALAEQAAKSLLAGDCKSPGRLAGDFLAGQYGYSSLAGDYKSPERLTDCKSPEHLAGANLYVQSNACVQSSEDEEYPAPPTMPKKLPKLVELLISKTPEIYQPAVACAIFPPLATHLWRTKFRYIDNVEHEATLMTCLLAGTGAGKSCVQKPIDFIMEDIRKRDAENLKREKEWKEEMMRKGANKDKRKRPENLIIQEIDADMTNPAFVMRTAEAKEHFLYTSLNEIDQFDALRGIGNQQFRIMCLAFDPSNKFGQSRVGIQSVTERVCVRFNWNASTTIDKGQRYFAKVLTDGPLSRINFCTIPEREIGEDIPIYGTYDDEFRNSLKPYIENLCMASGLVECQEAYDLAVVLKNENAEFARTSQNRIFENFSFRANVIAYLKACVLYVANGYRWEPEMDEFIRWSERYDLYCKMRFFGDMIARENSAGEKSSKRGPENLLQLLPDIFTMPQLDAIRMEHGLNAKGTRNVIKQWIYRGYIERISPPGEDGKSGYGYSSYSFKKLKYRHDGLVLEARFLN
ncbi:hypothetical protein NNC58_01945 [Prevotella copri]|uniref:Uncharacterized protein n=1 Tax=Segatella copri TaxID=165179 RepID=A0AAW5IEA2_9BACT|nr:hypothetical protein [Segatella copri]MCP9533479.1 hypothetical protein [Segatella copri]MCP9536329.1 hypothetical protein [Segatella copri]MCP9539234.1 hypothetical protein [Segatella copri]MCP9557621.1 hypothetical protein [Segatella copri]MCP9560475.1 hypothetical protein [Segatella copri]